MLGHSMDDPATPPPLDSALRERLTNLELLFTHLERTVAELNAVLLEQGRRLDRLAAALERLRDELPPAAGDCPPDETDP
jgi:uncharacterized coiled-coil protein SlyX